MRNYNTLPKERQYQILAEQGVVTARTIEKDCNVTKATAQKYFKEMVKNDPTVQMQLKNKKINGKVYGKTRPVNVVPGEVYDEWFDHHFEDEETMETVSEYTEELQKTKEELIDENLALKKDLQKLKDSLKKIINKI